MPSQYEEDRIIQRLLPQIRGTYMDVGCADPVVNSNTESLYARHWSGLCVDVRKELEPKWLARRPKDKFICSAVGFDNCKVDIYVPQDGELASCQPNWTDLPTVKQSFTEVSISTLWAKSGIGGVPTFLSIDVEGNEINAIKGCDFKEFKPTLICIESIEYATNRETWKEWEPLILIEGYELVWVTRNKLNRFYRLKAK